MKKVIALSLAVLILISGCSWFKKDPQKAVNEAIAKFADVKKFSSVLNVKGLVTFPQGETPNRIEFTVTAAGKSDVSDEKSPKIDTDLKVDAIFDGKTGSGEIIFRTISDKMFASLTKLEIPGVDAEEMQAQMASVLNKWWSMPLGENNPLDRLQTEREKLQAHFKNTRFFTNAREDGEEEIQGMKTVRYRVDLDKNELKKFLLDIARTEGNELNPDEEKAIEESLQDLEFSGAVWVGDDDIVHRIGGTLTLQPQQGPTSSFEIDYRAWDYGKDVEIAEPADAREFNPIMLYSLLGAFGMFEPQGASTPLATGTDTASSAVDDMPLGRSQVTQ